MPPMADGSLEPYKVKCTYVSVAVLNSVAIF